MWLGEKQKIKGSHCPSCNCFLDGASELNGDSKPKPGDITICGICGNVAIYDNQMDIRLPTSDELMELSKDENIIRVQFAIYLAKNFQKKPPEGGFH